MSSQHDMLFSPPFYTIQDKYLKRFPNYNRTTHFWPLSQLNLLTLPYSSPYIGHIAETSKTKLNEINSNTKSLQWFHEKAKQRKENSPNWILKQIGGFVLSLTIAQCCETKKNRIAKLCIWGSGLRTSQNVPHRRWFCETCHERSKRSFDGVIIFCGICNKPKTGLSNRQYHSKDIVLKLGFHGAQSVSNIWSPFDY